MDGDALDRSRMMVPSPVPVLTATVHEAVPWPLIAPTEAPEMPPPVVRLKLPAPPPKAAWSKVTVKLTLAAFDSAAAGAMELTVGAVWSIVRAVPELKVVTSGLKAESEIVGLALERSRRIVPSPVPVLTVTVYVVPEPARPVIEAPLTPVWVRLKLVASTPVTASLNVTVKSAVAAFVGVETGTMELTVGACASIEMVLPPKAV